MALLVPNGPSFAHWSDNLGPMNNGGSVGYGVSVPAGTSSADGADTAIMSALTHDCEYLWLACTGLGTGSLAPGALMDLLIDPAGGTSWSELITDLLVGSSGSMTYNTATAGIPLSYHFPLWIPAGASIGARVRRQSGTAGNLRVIVMAAGGNRNPASWWCGQKVETVGTMVPSSSIGQVHTPGGGASISGAADNGSGLIRLTVDSTAAFVTGDVLTVNSVNGTVEANGTWTITVIDATTLDLQGSTFVNAYSAGTDFINGKFSSWTNLGAPTGARTGAVQWSVGGITVSATQASATADFRFGAGGSEIGPRVYRGFTTGETACTIYQGPVFCDIPAGTQLQIRASLNLALNGNQTNYDCAAYCVQ